MRVIAAGKANVRLDLPTSLREWRDLDVVYQHWLKPWETLRPFFNSKGYRLYHCDGKIGSIPQSDITDPPALDSFGLFGERGEGFKCYSHGAPVVFAARDRLNRDVVIKVVSKGAENAHELKILQLLDSEPFKSDPLNATVPVVEFLQFEDWNFIVMPYCDDSFEPPMMNAEECLEFAEQVLSGLTFLHTNRIAHLDISYENILINHHGKIPETFFWSSPKEIVIWCPPPEFRSTFPVRYRIMDFGYSYIFPPSLPLADCWLDPMDKKQGRQHKAPEVCYARFNPFAADVYQTARLFYSWFYFVTPNIPGFLELLQDMTSFYPPDRPSAAVALERLRHLRARVPEEKRLEFVDRLEPGDWWPIVQRPFLRTLREVFLTRGWLFAAQFVFQFSKTRFITLLRRFSIFSSWSPK